MIKIRLKKLRDQFKKYNLDGYVVPKNDEFFSEYSSKDRLSFISNFNGSAGYAVILKDKNYLLIAPQQCLILGPKMVVYPFTKYFIFVDMFLELQELQDAPERFRTLQDAPGRSK